MRERWRRTPAAGQGHPERTPLGFDISWSLHRARGLDDGERRRAAAHVARWRNLIDGYDLMLPAAGDAPADARGGEDADGEADLIGWDSLRPSRGEPYRSDHGGYLQDVTGDVLDAMTELRELFADAELAVADDFGTYGWAGDGWEPFARKAREVASPASRDGWIAASTLQAAPQPAPAALEAL
ncbi:MAG: hypothetical protein ABL886_14170, partial [Rhodoglobus sp.]